MFPSWVCGRGVPRWFGSRRQYALCCWSRNVSVSACCSRPLSGSQAATVPSVAGWDDMPGSPVWWFRLFWFCGGHGPGETPGPIPNPVAKAWRGDGTAFERVWESSAPPHCTSVGGSRGAWLRESLSCFPPASRAFPCVPVPVHGRPFRESRFCLASFLSVRLAPGTSGPGILDEQYGPSGWD